MSIRKPTSIALVALVAGGCNLILGNTENEIGRKSSAQQMDAAAPGGDRDAGPKPADDASARDAGGSTEPEAGTGGDEPPSMPASGTGGRAGGAGRGGSGGNAGRGGSSGSAGRGGSGGAAGSAGSAGITAGIGGGAGQSGSSGAGAGGSGEQPFCAAADRAGMSCDDGQYCTTGETCQNLTCSGGQRRACPASTVLCQVNECSESEDACVLRPATDGGACGNGKTCDAGACVCPSGQTSESNCADGVDNDCDGDVDCGDSDCGSQTCAGGGARRCCSGACVDTAVDPQNCGGCGVVCPAPPSTAAPEGDRIGCVYIDFCDYPDHPAGVVCRAYSNCGVTAANAEECREDADVTCGTLRRPFWFCDRSSSNCQILP